MRNQLIRALTSPRFNRFPFYGVTQEFVDYLNEQIALIDERTVGVAGLGDSMLVTGTTSGLGRYHSSVISKLGIGLQGEFNPTSIKGGRGFIPLVMGGGSGTPTGYATNTPVTSADAPNFGNGDTFTQYELADGTGAKAFGLASGKTRYLGLNLNTADANVAWYRWYCSHFKVVGRTYSGGPTMRIDAGVGSWPAAGSTTTQLVGGAKTWDTNSGSTVYGARSALIEVANRASANRLVVRGGSSGGVAYIDGIDLMDGDATAGIHVADMCCPGAQITGFTANSRTASIDQWCLGESGADRQHTAMYVISFLLNDANNASVSPEDFEANYLALLAEIRATESDPNIVLLCPHKPNFSGFTYTVDRFNEFRDVLLGLPSQVERCCVLDSGDYTKGDTYDGVATRRGMLADGTHFSDLGHQMVADSILDLWRLAK